MPAQNSTAKVPKKKLIKYFGLHPTITSFKNMRRL